MAIAAIGERGAFRGALLGCIAAAGTERAAGRHIERTRHVAGEDDALPLARGLRVGIGTAESSDSVYGWTGCSFRSSASAISTILPRYMTAMRFEM